MKRIVAFLFVLMSVVGVSAQKDLTPDISQKDHIPDVSEVVGEIVEPKFRGNMKKFLEKSLRYPPEALYDKIEGRAIVKFVVERDGSVSNVVVENADSIYPLLAWEAKRVVESMPKWKPGRLNGKKVRVLFTLPINFILPIDLKL